MCVCVYIQQCSPHQLLGGLPEESLAQVGWLGFGGEKLKTGIKIAQTSLKIGLVFLQGVHLPGKIHIYMGRVK